MLQKNGIYPPRFENLKPFPGILLRKRMVPTRVKTQIHNVKIVPEGVALSFTLEKGAYATTLFAHLFQLLADRPPKEIPQTARDLKDVLEEKPITETLEYFKSFLEAKTQNPFGENE
jgi:hypothetical protein